MIHLKVHSAYSLLEGALPIKTLVNLCLGHDFPAVAVTDTNNLFGALEFSEKAAENGIQPLIGVSLAARLADQTGQIGLIAMSETGYRNLLKLVSSHHLSGVADLEALKRHAEGLILLSGGPDGPIDTLIRQKRVSAALSALRGLHGAFGDRLYVELQRHYEAREVEEGLLELAYGLELPIVGTNEVYFATPDDYDAHDALLCIADQRYVIEEDRRKVTREHYFKSKAEMEALFSDLPEAIANTVEIAQRCHFRPTKRKPMLPHFLPGDEAAELRRQAHEGLMRRLEHGQYAGCDYLGQLNYELDVIERMGFPGYFLIVADFIRWAKTQGIPVGPGRGSGAGSVVSWALGITNLDPLRFGLLFERFLNPDRVSMPDFDIDFCQERRDEVIRYVQLRYGHVAHIITHGKLQARSLMRDVGRVLHLPYKQVDTLCKMVPFNPANPLTLEEAIQVEPRLQEAQASDASVAHMIGIALKLEGCYRHASTHAAGLVIGDRPLDELIPLYADPKSDIPVTQFNWKMVEAAGLVKFDFLGLKTLTVLKKAVDLISRRGITVDLDNLPLDDHKTFELLADADTVGVFQLESTGMRNALKRLKPDRFEDIIAMVALYRPGPMDNIDAYIERKHGREPVHYYFDCLEPILRETYGVVIYQEQVMQIAQVFAGYSLAEADLLRRAMGKKDKTEMAAQKARFVEGAVKKGFGVAAATQMFDLVDKFAGYGFNKSHAAAYAMISYQTAYLKAHFREEFFAASMTLDINDTDKLSVLAADARKTLEVKPPCVNASAVEFLPEPGAVRWSLMALKQVGLSTVQAIPKEQPFKDLADFARRVDVTTLDKRVLLQLAAAGAFDSLVPDRAVAYSNAERVLNYGRKLTYDGLRGMRDLFEDQMEFVLVPARPWSDAERLEYEFDSTGVYLSGHPLDDYEPVFEELGVKRWVDLEEGINVVAGVVVSAREKVSQRGNAYAYATFSDISGQFEAVMFADVLATARNQLVPGNPVLLTVDVQDVDGSSLRVFIRDMRSLEKVAAQLREGLTIELRSPADVADLRPHLRPGTGLLRLILHVDGRSVEFTAPGRWELGPRTRDTLGTLPGVHKIV